MNYTQAGNAPAASLRRSTASAPKRKVVPALNVYTVYQRVSTGRVLCLSFQQFFNKLRPRIRMNVFIAEEQNFLQGVLTVHPGRKYSLYRRRCLTLRFPCFLLLPFEVFHSFLHFLRSDHFPNTVGGCWLELPLSLEDFTGRTETCE